jgi:hypothetical protein
LSSVEAIAALLTTHLHESSGPVGVEDGAVFDGAHGAGPQRLQVTLRCVLPATLPERLKCNGIDEKE